MAIPFTAQCRYTVTLRHGADGPWRGTADPADQGLSLVGDAPAIELDNGRLTLSRRALTPERLRAGFGTPVVSASVGIGDALETVLRDGDRLQVLRGGMAELALVLRREERLVMALGVVTEDLKEAGIGVEVDPRADDGRFYYMRSLLDRKDAMLVWLDPASAEYEAQLSELDRIPPHVTMVSIAARCDDWTTSTAVNRRAVGDNRRSHRWGFNYERVDARVRTREEFVRYLRGLPDRRRTDVFLRFAAGGQVVDLRAGECAALDPWLLSVGSVRPADDGWAHSHLGVARMHPALTAERLLASVQAVLRGGMQFEPR
jgi:hypothetical protein